MRPLRLWPGVAAVVLQWLLWFVLPVVAPDAAMLGILGGVVCGLVVLLWWLFFSRAPWAERLGAIVFMVVALIATKRVVDPSIAGGMMGNMLYGYSIPPLSLALVASAVAGRRLSSGPRRAVMAGAILLGCSVFTLLRTGGITGGAASDLHWRWTPTPEERLLAEALPPAPAPTVAPAPEPAPAPAAASLDSARDRKAREKAGPGPADANMGAEWSGFRGSNRDSVIHGVKIDADWSRSKPVEMWRRPIGPGWSSFAVHGNLLYTQEQRGDDEMVSCYDLTTGAPVWKHRDKVRFYESNGGAGPRGTPTVSHGRIYAFGATGILNALDARDGSVIWSRNAASDAEATLPGWGFTSSPLVVDDEVIVAAAGTLAAYDLATGKPRWVGPHHGFSYSSPQLATIDGVAQILLLSGPGVVSVAPADGALLWEHSWEGGAIVQPALTADGDVLINAMSPMGGVGTRRLAVAHGPLDAARGGPGSWTVTERWTSAGLKPYFNDFVVHKGHAFGFDGNILACIDLSDGKRLWKGGRYGNGQIVLLADQDVLLVLSEEGELALVSATTDEFKELARFTALEGKTWNHPVLVGDVLLVRNGEEMAAFRLKLAGR
jgi:outer membrane protein assembly factor BamB